MNISVIVLTHNNEDTIGECLDSILRQDYQNGIWELFVIDDNSRDKTVDIVKSKYIRTIPHLTTTIAYGRNMALWLSKYEYIAFTDADCVVPKDWLNKLSRNFSGWGVGGSNVPPDTTPFYKALSIYLNSPLGSFNSVQGRNFKKMRKVSSLSCTNVLYKKSVLTEVGGFDEGLGNISEDLDIGIRLNKAGYNLYFVPDIAVTHYMRNNLCDWLKNMAMYGRGRAKVTRKYRLYRNSFFLLPIIFLASLPLLPFTYLPLLAIYVLLIKKQAPYFLTLTIFITTHFVYAWGLLWEMIRKRK